MKKKKDNKALSIAELKTLKGFENLPDEQLTYALGVMESLAKIAYGMKVVGAFNIELLNKKQPYGKS